jgi:flagellar biosynthetic protein FliR
VPVEALAQYLKLPVFALVASRLGGLLMFQPVFSALSVPIHLRVMLVLALGALMTPLVSLPAAAPDRPLEILFALGAELLLGLLLGVLTALCFVGLQMGGLLIAQESGLAFGQIVDPSSDEQETVVGVFYLQFALVIFLVIGGHRALLSACLDTFETIPLLTCRPTHVVDGDVLCRALTLSGQVAFRVAGPTLLALLLVNVALGFVSRTMPQLNILAVGFSLKGILVFALMAASLPSAGAAFIDMLEAVFSWVNALIGVSPHGPR